MKILFEVWGNYKNWQKVSYRYNQTELESKTTLPLLLNETCPQRCFIIVSDTLIENIIDNNSNILSYEEYIKKIEKDVKNFIETVEVCENDIEKCEILVLPGVGTFNKTNFIGNPLNFHSALYYKLVNIIINIITENKSDNQFEIYLDITHGINYMTMMTYRVIKEISQILAFFYKMKLVVLNSDPKIGSENVKLVINKIEDSNIIPRLDFYSFNDTYILRPSKNLLDEEKKKFGQDCPKINKEVFDKIFSFVGSFLDALPLYTYSFYFNDELKFLDEAYEFFYKSIKIENQYNKMIINHCANFTGIFISIMQYKFLKLLLKENYVIENKDEVSLNELISLQNIFDFSRTLKQRLAKEIKKIQDIKNKLNSDYKDYGSYVLENYKDDNNFDERNFFAHCGFGYNILQLKKENDEIILKVKDCFVDEIKNHIIGNITKGD